MITFIKKKIAQYSREINLIKGTHNIDPSCYISGCEISGKLDLRNNCKIHRAQLHGNITINRFSSLWGPNITMYASTNTITIGSFCSIARDVSFQEYNHYTSRLSTAYVHKNIFKNNKSDITSHGGIEVGNDVWIGMKSSVLSGVKIGHGAIIGANSLVTKDIPPFGIAVGSPAKVVAFRFSDDIIQQLLVLQWWNWDLGKIRLNEKLFSSEITAEVLNQIMEPAIKD
ncbi:CatB-related O-acetyltransferase [Gilvimarinus agarilyticus]|nr:CatB-related O-acetyltransferase [Gilvimarinus agarilyticus]